MSGPGSQGKCLPCSYLFAAGVIYGTPLYETLALPAETLTLSARRVCANLNGFFGLPSIGSGHKNVLLLLLQQEKNDPSLSCCECTCRSVGSMWTSVPQSEL